MSPLASLLLELAEEGRAHVSSWFLRSLGYSIDTLALTLGVSAAADSRGGWLLVRDVDDPRWRRRP